MSRVQRWRPNDVPCVTTNRVFALETIMDDQLAPPEITDYPMWYTLNELHRLSGYSEQTIRRWVRARRIPFIQPGGKGGHLRFPADALAVIQAQKVEVESTVPRHTTTVHPAKLPGRKPKCLDN